MKNKELEVIIIGGGIGGLCLAQGLKKFGHKFEIFERNQDNDSWLEGYRINVNQIGSNALYNCLPKKLWDAFLAGVSDPTAGLGFITEQLKELVVVDEEMLTGYTNDPAKRQYAIGRKTLRKILQAGLEHHISYNKKFKHYEQLDDARIKVHFEDGTNVIGDVLIGADGANSAVRKQLLPYATRLTTDAVAIAGKTLLTAENRKWLPAIIKSRMNVVMPLKKYFFFNAAFDHIVKNATSAEKIKTAAVNAGIDPATFFDHNDNYILWSFIANKNEFKRELQNLNADIIRSVLQKIDNWHPDIKRLIMEADPLSTTLLQLKVMGPIKNWQPTNVTILGDAAHNMPPLYGMGANMALHDALILCMELNKVACGACQLPDTLNAFQQKMLKDGFKVLNAALTYTNQASSSNFLQRWFSRGWFRLCNIFTPLKKMSFEAKWNDLLIK